MIKKFIFLTTLFLLVLGGGRAWADNVTLDFTGSSLSKTGTGAENISFTGGSHSSSGYQTIETNGTFTVSSTTSNITKIVVTYTDNNVDRTGDGSNMTTSPSGYSYDNNVTGTWEGTATNSVSFTCANSRKARISTIIVTVSSSASVATKTIAVSNMKYSKNVSKDGLNATNGLDRTIGGFSFAYTGGDNVKYNNGNDIRLRNSGGQLVITPVTSGTGTVTIVGVDITVHNSSYGVLTINESNHTIDGSSSTTYSFTNDASTFTMTSSSGNPGTLIESFTIHYTDPNGVLNETKITPTITWSKSSDNITSTTGYASPTITTVPANYDISLASGNTTVATVPAEPATDGEYWNQKSLVTLTGTNGSATVTASSASDTYFNAAAAASYMVLLTPAPVTFSPAAGEVTSGTEVTLSCATDGTTIYYTTDGTEPNSSSTAYSTPISITEATTIKALAIKDGQAGSVSTAAYTVSGAVVTLTPESDRTWTFSGFTTTTFTSTVLENNMEFGADATHKMAITSSNKTYEGVKYTSRLQFQDAGTSTYRYIHFKVAANTKVSVWGVSAKSGDTRTIYIDAGSFGTHTANLGFTETMQTLSTNDGDITSESDVWIYCSSGVNIYGVKVEPVGKSTLTRFSPKGGQYTTLNKVGRTTWPDFEILYEPTDAGIESSQLSISSSDASVIGTSGVTFDCSTAGKVIVKGMPMGVGGTSRVTFTFSGNDSYASATTYVDLTVTAPGPFNIVAPDQDVQRGQLTAITPIITDNSGNRIGIRETATSGVYETYVLDEEEETPDYSEYFNFTFTDGSGSGTNYDQITVVDATFGQIRTESTDGTTAAEVGAWRNITVQATPKPAYQSLFSTGSTPQSVTTKITIIAKVAEIQLKFYWDAACTREVSASEYSEDATKLRTFNSGIFSGGFPNGRMFYAKLSDEAVAAGVNAIWFSYAENGNAATISDDPSINKKKRIFKYNRGVPILIDGTLNSGDYVTLNIVAVNSNGNLYGSMARFKFPLVSHARPEAPTYDPVSPDADSSKNKVDDDKSRKIMDTSENVVAYGASGNLVYGKFSTSTVYHTEQLINEEHVQKGISSVPVVSTEVAKRRFTAVQIYTNTLDGTYGYGEYISPQTYTEYWYLYDTRLALTPSGNEYINVSGSATGNTVSSARESTVKWYNKITPGWQDVDTKTVTFSIVTRNGASDATINETTGAVTAGTQTGWVRVRAYYAGGETHGGTTGEPQYVSTTAPSDAYFYVYIADPSKEEPEITPPSRNFTSTQAFKIKAPANWDVYYTLDGSTPAYGNGTYLKHGSTFEGVATSTTTVQAIAYNPASTTNVSRIVSETYTKVDPLPDPIFDPDGVPTPYYYYTTTLTVQIACARAGAVIYYTVDGSEPEIGAEGTYKYSGLEKVVISGNTAIKAIAYDPATDIFSNVVTSNYIYTTDMEKPYFQVSEDGTTWKGLASAGATTLTVDGTCWYGGEEITIAPSWQIRIVDPNSIQGTVYFTLDGSVPGESSNAIKYATPFTIAKTTTGKAVTVIDEASSQVSTAVFNIDSSRYPVWEAVEQTTPGGVMAKDDGFVISTNSSLAVNNTASKVNLNSISSSYGGTSDITYAQADITATFGGYDLEGWSYMTIADDAIGTPLDNVGDYTIKATDNARIEAKVKRTNDSGKEVSVDAYNHIYSELTTTHEKTFKLPAKGAYVRFEPEKDGDLTIWVLQQGSLHYEDDQYLCDKFIRCRPVYFVDEQGKSYPVKSVNGVKQMWSTARLSANWSRVKATAEASSWAGFIETKANGESGDGKGQYIELRDGSTKWIPNTGFTVAESGTLYTRFNNYLTSNGISVGDPIQPIAIHTGTATHSQANGLYKDSNNDGTGYVLISGGYAKYTFEVKAGKTYFFLGQGTKIGIRGFQFVPTEETSSRNLITIHANATTDASTVNTPAGEKELSEAVGTYGGNTVNVKLERTFKANTWTTLVVPFSVSVAQIEKVFGPQTDIILFDDVINNDKEIHMIRHWHKMLVAGTPVIIMPRQDVTDPTFYGVQLETSEVDNISSTNGHYTMTGTLVKAENALKKWDYYINTSGNFTYLNIDQASVKGSFSWLQATASNPNPARMLTVSFADFSDADEDDENLVTGIINVELPDGLNSTNAAKTGAVYNLKGQKVGDNSLESLPKGIYIVNGKKVVVE